SFSVEVDKLTGELRDKVERVVRATGARGAVITRAGAVPALVGEPALGTLRPDTFAQVSADSNALLVEAAVEQMQVGEGRLGRGLFAGAGNFALPLAAGGGAVVAVEYESLALGLLRDAANRRGLGSRVRAIQTGAIEGARSLAQEGQRFE